MKAICSFEDYLLSLLFCKNENHQCYFKIKDLRKDFETIPYFSVRREKGFAPLDVEQIEGHGHMCTCPLWEYAGVLSEMISYGELEEDPVKVFSALCDMITEKAAAICGGGISLLHVDAGCKKALLIPSGPCFGCKSVNYVFMNMPSIHASGWAVDIKTTSSTENALKREIIAESIARDIAYIGSTGEGCLGRTRGPLRVLGFDAKGMLHIAVDWGAKGRISSQIILDLLVKSLYPIYGDMEIFLADSKGRHLADNSHPESCDKKKSEAIAEYLEPIIIKAKEYGFILSFEGVYGTEVRLKLKGCKHASFALYLIELLIKDNVNPSLNAVDRVVSVDARF